MREWLLFAIEPTVVRRALRCTVVVGIILIAINYGDLILRGELCWSHLLKMLLTVFVPYMVSTVSSIAAIREMRSSTPPNPPSSSPP